MVRCEGMERVQVATWQILCQGTSTREAEVVACTLVEWAVILLDGAALECT